MYLYLGLFRIWVCVFMWLITICPLSTCLSLCTVQPTGPASDCVFMGLCVFQVCLCVSISIQSQQMKVSRSGLCWRLTVFTSSGSVLCCTLLTSQSLSSTSSSGFISDMKSIYRCTQRQHVFLHVCVCAVSSQFTAAQHKHAQHSPPPPFQKKNTLISSCRTFSNFFLYKINDLVTCNINVQ